MPQPRPSLIGFFLTTILLLIVTAGCINKAVPNEETENAQDEQLYIDAEMGFTILHPLHWEKIQLPVSSPDYRQDTLSWEIPGAGETARMDIRVFSEQSSEMRLEDLLQEFMLDKPEHSSEEIVPYQHVAGETIVTTIYYPEHAQRLFAILGDKQTFILSFFASSEGFVEYLSLFEKIAESFREL